MKKAIYRVYTNEMEGEYTEGYIELTAEELENLSCRDSDYEYEEVIVSKDLGYLKLYREVIKNNTERLKKEEEYKQWLEDNFWIIVGAILLVVPFLMTIVVCAYEIAKEGGCSWLFWTLIVIVLLCISIILT